MRKHHAYWYQLARDRIGFDCKPEDVVISRGWVKTTNWTVAAFLQEGRSQKVSLQGQFTPLAGVGFDLSFANNSACLRECRTGPKLSDGQSHSSPRDQCIFLPLYKIRYRTIPFLAPKIEAGAGPHQLPPHDDDGPLGAVAQVVADPEAASVSDVAKSLNYCSHDR